MIPPMSQGIEPGPRRQAGASAPSWHPIRHSRAAAGLCALVVASMASTLHPCPATAATDASVPEGPRITTFQRDERLGWAEARPPGICVLQTASSPQGPWTPAGSAYGVGSDGTMALPPQEAPLPTRFHRLEWLTVPPTSEGFSHLVQAHGILETLAGNGSGQADGVNYWQEWNEGEPAVFAALSRPHFALADSSGNVYIADKGSHSILRVDTRGRIHTHAGTHLGGFDGEGPAPATALSLKEPNGLWVRADGTVYVLDTGNGRVRRVSTSGGMVTLFRATPDGSPLAGGRSLWVRPDETLAYFGAETRIRVWTPSGGVRTLASGFSELGALHVEGTGNLLVCDRGAHRVYRVTPSGIRTPIAGNGTPTGGGDGFPALATGLNGVRGVWTLPIGGILLLTHDGCQLWHVDTAGTIRLLLHGAGGRTHAGDGMHFYQPDLPMISEGRSVSLDPQGNILLCESDWGYIRRIRFAPIAEEWWWSQVATGRP